MDFKVDKILENTYSIIGEGNIFTAILEPQPKLTNENELISEAFLLKREEGELVCHKHVKLMILMSKYTKSGLKLKEHLFDLLKDEAMKILNIDLSEAFNNPLVL